MLLTGTRKQAGALKDTIMNMKSSLQNITIASSNRELTLVLVTDQKNCSASLMYGQGLLYMYIHGLLFTTALIYMVLLVY